MTVDLPPPPGSVGPGHATTLPEPRGVEVPAPAGGVVAAAVRTAMAAGELVLQYQPQFAPGTGEVQAAEALVRWARPGHGLLLPDRFLPALRGHEVLDELTEWVVEQAVRQLRAWRDVGFSLSIAVNIAPETLSRADVVAMVERGCQRMDVAPSSLVVEITEDVLDDDGGRARRQLAELRRCGVRVALDDFGVGGASLARLRDLPIDQIKLDGRFVGRCAANPRDLAIVRTVKDLADRLAVQTVAECVEDEATRALLAELGYDLLQGYGLCRPCDPDRMLDLSGLRLAGPELDRRYVAGEGPAVTGDIAGAPDPHDPPVPGDSDERRALSEEVLCDAVGAVYTDLAAVAADLAECPQARVSLLTDVEAVVGAAGDPGEARLLAASLGSLVLSAPEGTCHVRDLWADQRTRLLPDAQGPCAVRFLAAAALRSADGTHVIGALSVLDYRPRVLSAGQRRGLERLAAVTAERLLLGTGAHDGRGRHAGRLPGRGQAAVGGEPSRGDELDALRLDC